MTWPGENRPDDQDTPVDFVGQYVRHEGDTTKPVFGFVKLTIEERFELARELLQPITQTDEVNP